MKKFWKKEKNSPRTWEEITNPKSQETEKDDVSDAEDKANGNITEEKMQQSNSEKEKTSTNKKLKKKGFDKFFQTIETLDFDPTSYYGWGDGKVDSWMQKLTKVWNVIASVAWFIFGSTTFAPILFTANKLDKFFNDKKKSFLIASVLYLVAILFIFTVILF